MFSPTEVYTAFVFGAVILQSGPSEGKLQENQMAILLSRTWRHFLQYGWQLLTCLKIRKRVKSLRQAY